MKSGLRTRVTHLPWPQRGARTGALKGWELLPICSFPSIWLFSTKESLLPPNIPHPFWKRKGGLTSCLRHKPSVQGQSLRALPSA